MATGRKCRGCGETGHRRPQCPKEIPAARKKKAGAVRVTVNGHGGAVGRALGELRAERDRLDGAIAALEALADTKP